MKTDNLRSFNKPADQLDAVHADLRNAMSSRSDSNDTAYDRAISATRAAFEIFDIFNGFLNVARTGDFSGICKVWNEKINGDPIEVLQRSANLILGADMSN